MTAEALPLAEEAVAIYDGRLPESHPHRADAKALLARLATRPVS